MNRNDLPYRQIHLDFHTSPYIEGVGEGFDSREFIDTLKKAHVSSINLFAKCHHGMYYYPTKIGTMHPNLKFDLFGEQVKACKENNIRVIAYTCVSWNEDWAGRHPEWLTLCADGVRGVKKPFEDSFYSWRHICHNNREYQAVLRKEFKEIFDLYHPDGFWADIIQGKKCICSTCSADMKAMGLDPEREEDAEYFDRISEMRFCKSMYQYIKSLDEDLEVYFNSLPYRLDDGEDREASSAEKRKYFDFIDIESLPSEQWGYTHFPVAVNYLNKYDKPLCMMNGKFHTSWGDFGSLRHKTALEYECMRAVSNGAGVCVGDQLHPVGRLDKPVYQRIGEIFGQIEAREPWLYNTEKISEIGVLIPLKAGHDEDTVSVRSIEGVYRILSELHYLFDYVNVEDPLEKYSLLILPDQAELSDETAMKINRYIENGGKILMTGSSGLKDGRSQISSMELVHHGKSDYTMQYIRLDENLFDDIPQIDHILYEAGERVTGKGDILARIVEPYFERTYDRFCSHRQTPPKPTAGDEPGIIRLKGGIYVSFPVFRLYSEYAYTVYRDILKDCLRELIKTPCIKTDLPAITELTLRKNDKGFILHMLNYVIERKAKQMDTIEERFTVCDRSVKIYTEKSPLRVVKIPRETEVPFDHFGGYTEIKIEKEDGYTGYAIEVDRGPYLQVTYPKKLEL
ncbi:MAG: beta-galactosidase trimerization domain-containing protein [Lachnospiraceae bacterium]|nr:beta-galactosidase trimerization domain-containing protein [Lachnospiraceae bacterium]